MGKSRKHQTEEDIIRWSKKEKEVTSKAEAINAFETNAKDSKKGITNYLVLILAADEKTSIHNKLLQAMVMF